MPGLMIGIHYSDCPFYYEGCLYANRAAVCVWCMAHDQLRR